MKNEEIERIEGLVDLAALAWFKISTNTIIKDMVCEGWEYSDAKKYLFDRIEENIDTCRYSPLIGKKCIIIDEVQSKNNVKICTISGLGENGGICFEDYNGETIFALERDEEFFLKGYKAWIHPDEVSIQLVG